MRILLRMCLVGDLVISEKMHGVNIGQYLKFQVILEFDGSQLVASYHDHAPCHRKGFLFLSDVLLGNATTYLR